MRIDILTLFPDSFPPVLDTSIVGRAQEAGHVEIVLHNIRDWADNTHNRVDDRPFGGGPGMVLMCQPLHDAVRSAEQEDERPARRILLSPQGERLTQERVEELASEQRLLLIAGHYEGVDERIIDELEPLELSVGDFVLSGGEIPAMLLTDAVTRLLPGVLGHEQSAAEDSFARRGSEGTRLLDCPHYTRPRSWMGRGVPEVLLGGDHGAVDQWRMEQMKERTQQRRPDLLQHEEV